MGGASGRSRQPQPHADPRAQKPSVDGFHLDAELRDQIEPLAEMDARGGLPSGVQPRKRFLRDGGLRRGPSGAGGAFRHDCSDDHLLARFQAETEISFEKPSAPLPTRTDESIAADVVNGARSDLKGDAELHAV